MEFEWDDAKDAATQHRRGIRFATGAAIFDGVTLAWKDQRRDYGEERWCAIGQAGTAMLFVAYTDRGVKRRIISVRRANRREIDLWLSSE